MAIDNKEDNTPIGLVIQFINAESCVFAEASLACSYLAPIVYVPILLISCAHAPSLSFLQAKTPHLDYIGVPNPPRGSSSMSSYDDGDACSSHREHEAVAAAEAYILGAPPPPGTGNLLIDVNEDQDEKLLVLRIIWECPMINTIAGFEDNGEPFSRWTCGWCPLKNNGSSPKPYQMMNATKALVHFAKVSGYDIRPCRGRIPAAKSRQYQDLHLSKTSTKEQWNSRRDTMVNSIADMQDWTVLALAEGAKKSSRHTL